MRRPLTQSDLTHRLVINFATEAAGRTAADIVAEVVKEKRWQPR